MRWTLLAVALIVFVANAALWWRMRQERIERHLWKGFRSNPPFDLTGWEQFDRMLYTPAGQRLYPWFIGSTVVLLTLAVFCAIVYGG